MAEDPDAIYYFDAAEQQKLMLDQPWMRHPRHRYFRRARISMHALMKMTTHANSDLDVSVLGILLGKFDGDSFVVMDAFALPCVWHVPEILEHMVELLLPQRVSPVGRMEKQVGYYHSQPGHGRWLSRAMVSEMMRYREENGPCFTVMIDPKSTLYRGEVDIGAYRVYPRGYKPLDETESEFHNVPPHHEHFGLHCKQYYSLDISYFESSLDSHLFNILLREDSWIRILSSRQLPHKKEYVAERISDLAKRVEDIDLKIMYSSPEVQQQKENNSRLRKLSKDTAKIIQGQVHDLLSMFVKNSLFEPADQFMEAHPVPQESADPDNE